MGRFSRLANEMGDIERLAWDEVWLYAKDSSSLLRSITGHHRRTIVAALIDEILSAQNGVCPLCFNIIERSTIPAFHVDHVIPFTYGGGYERGNLQVVHPLCNRKKGDYVDLRDLVPYLEQKASEL